MATKTRYSWATSTEAIKNYISDPGALADLKKEYNTPEEAFIEASQKYIEGATTRRKNIKQIIKVNKTFKRKIFS